MKSILFMLALSLSSQAEIGQSGSKSQNINAVSTTSSEARELSRPETCQQLAKDKPDLIDSINLEGGPAPSLSLRARAKQCVSGVGGAWADTVRKLVIDPANALFNTSIDETRAYLIKCMASMECKRGLHFEAYGRSPSATEDQGLQNMTFAQMDVLYRNAVSRMNSTGMQNQRLIESQTNRQWMQTHRGSPTADGESGSFWSLIRGKIQSERTKWSCLTNEAAQELTCYYIAQVVDPLVAAGMVTKIPKLAKLVSGATEASGGARAANAADNAASGGRSARLARNASLSNSARISEAERLLGKTLTPGQRQALISAHNVGSARPGAGIGTYTRSEIREKARILAAAGFDTQQTRSLMSEGLAGRSVDILTTEIRLGAQPSRSRSNLAEARQSLGGTNPEYALMKPTSPAQFEAAKSYHDAVGRNIVSRGGDRAIARDPFLRAGNVDAYIETFRARNGDFISGQKALYDAEIARLTQAKRQIRLDDRASRVSANDFNRTVQRPDYPRADQSMYSDEYVLHMERTYDEAIQALRNERELDF